MDDLERYFNSFLSNKDLQSLKKEEQKTEDGGSTTITTTRLGPESFLSPPGPPDPLDLQNIPFFADEKLRRSLDPRPESSTCSVPLEVLETPEDLRIIPQIQNVISSVQLGCRLDLDFITRTTWNTEYKPKKFRALTMRIREPRTTANIYQNGALVCTGAKSTEDSHRAARRFARILQRLGFPVCFQNFKITNVVASCTTFPLSLESLNQAHRQNCSYEPELFPALFLKMVPGVTAIVFVNGKLILNGAKSSDEVHEAFRIIYPVLSPFRKL